ncbi:hypothetical protein N9P82_00705 [bacterium]|nr:hypothetical protein [bacterium]
MSTAPRRGEWRCQCPIWPTNKRRKAQRTNFLGAQPDGREADQRRVLQLGGIQSCGQLAPSVLLAAHGKVLMNFFLGARLNSAFWNFQRKSF